MNKFLFGFLLAAFVVTIACNDAQLVGSELFDDQTIEIEFTDMIHPEVTTVAPDSLVAFTATGTSFRRFQEYMLGQTDDPIWGTHKSGLYLTSGIMSSSLPDFEFAELDSLVMVIPLDTVVRYGDTMATHNINVYRLNEFPGSTAVTTDRVDTFYTNSTFEFDPIPVGQVSVIPSYMDSACVFNPAVDSIVKQSPQIRIPMDDLLAMEMLNTNFVSSDSMYQSSIRGFYIESIPDANSLMGIRIENFTFSSTSALLAMHYRRIEADTIDTLVHNFSLGIIKNQSFEHDYTGSDVELGLNGDNTKTYIMGMAGVDTEVDLSPVMDFADKGINLAQLEVTLDPDQIVDGEHPAIPALYAVYGENDLILEDIFLSEPISFIEQTFGGVLEEIDDNGTTKMVYRMNITRHVNNLTSGEISDMKIKLISRAKLETPARSVLIGNSGDDNEIKLKLIVTNP